MAELIVFPLCLACRPKVALHKGGSTQDVNNFRPISLLSIFDQIIENQIKSNQIKSNQIFSDNNNK